MGIPVDPAKILRVNGLRVKSCGIRSELRRFGWVAWSRAGGLGAWVEFALFVSRVKVVRHRKRDYFCGRLWKSIGREGGREAQGESQHWTVGGTRFFLQDLFTFAFYR